MRKAEEDGGWVDEGERWVEDAWRRAEDGGGWLEVGGG